jgi:hypothetical protein
MEIQCTREGWLSFGVAPGAPDLAGQWPYAAPKEQRILMSFQGQSKRSRVEWEKVGSDGLGVVTNGGGNIIYTSSMTKILYYNPFRAGSELARE